MKKNKAAKSMAEVSAGYEEFIKGKDIIRTGNKFNKVVKKAATPKPKQRASK